MKRKHFVAARILAFLILIVGTITVVSCANKIVTTSAQLMRLNDNIQYYNESARKTDEMTNRCEEYFAERAKFYQSEDSVIHFFANLPTLLKLVVLFAALASYPLVLFMWALRIIMRIRAMQRKRPTRDGRNNISPNRKSNVA